MDAIAQLDAAGRLKHLQDALSADAAKKLADETEEWRRRYTTEAPVAPSAPAAAVAPTKIGVASSLPRRLLKTCLGLAIVVFVGLSPVQRLMQTASVEAVVNARIITLRSPIEGEVLEGSGEANVGAALASGDVLFRVVDRRADRSRLDDLTLQLQQLRDEQPGLAARLASRQALLANLAGQTKTFAAARVRQLEARKEELTANAAAARARREDADAALDRATRLASSGSTSSTQLSQAKRDARIAEQIELATQKQIDAAAVELDAAQNGIFVGDSYNDRPSSAQRADEVQQEIVDLTAALADRESRISRISKLIADEEVRFANLSSTDIRAPAKGRVWEILTAPGEQVHRGQDLLRLLDCSGSLVTAAVSESVYDRLQIGSRARFRPRDGGTDLPGRVISLTGASSSPANFAIEPSALVQGAYHVAVAIPDLGTGQNCAVGRTGRVIFDDDSSELLAGLRRELP